MTSLALCAVKGDPLSKRGPGAEERVCQGTCGRTIIVSPTTLALGDIRLMCNECGRRAAVVAYLASGHRPLPRIAPGALRQDTPDDRRRRNELEAHGFRDLSDDERRDLFGGEQ